MEEQAPQVENSESMEKTGGNIMKYLGRIMLGVGLASVFVLIFLVVISNNEALQICDSEDAIAVAFIAAVAAFAAFIAAAAAAAVVAVAAVAVAVVAYVVAIVAGIVFVAVVIVAFAAFVNISIALGIELFIILIVFGATVGLLTFAIDKKKISENYRISVIVLSVCFALGVLFLNPVVLDYRSYLNMDRAEELLEKAEFSEGKWEIPVSSEEEGRWLVSHLYYQVQVIDESESISNSEDEQIRITRMPIEYSLTTVTIQRVIGEATNQVLSWEKQDMPLHLFSYDKDKVVHLPAPAQ